MQTDPSNKWNDQEFEDHAWSQMSALLDKELPVEKKKRRVVFWWLFAAGIGLLLIGGIVWSLQQREVALPIAGGEEQAVELEEMVEVPKTDMANALERNTKSSNVSGSETAEQAEVKQAILATKQPNSRTSKNQEGSLEKMIEVKEEVMTLTILSKNQQTATDIIKPAAIQANEEEVEQGQVADITALSKANSNIERDPEATQRKQSFLEQLPKMAYGSLSNDKLSIPEKVQQPFSKDHWRVSINGGAVLPIDHTSRLFLGTQLNYQWHSKWSIGMGANYIFGRSTATDDDLLFGTTEVEDTPMLEFDNMFADADSSFTGQFSSTSLLQLPISIAHRFHPRWQLFGGVAYLLPIQQSNEADELSDPNGRVITTTTAVGTFEETAPHFQSSWQWQAGVSFQATTRLGLQAQYQQQFDQQKVHPLRQSFQVGLRYQLAKW